MVGGISGLSRAAETELDLPRRTAHVIVDVTRMRPEEMAMVEHDEHSASERTRTDRVVFGATAALLVGFLSWGVGPPSTLGSAAESALNWSVDDIGWVFVLAATGFVIFVLWIAMRRSGTIPLGRDDERPEFHYRCRRSAPSW